MRAKGGSWPGRLSERILESMRGYLARRLFKPIPGDIFNPWEELNRLRKAIRLADVLDAHRAETFTVQGLSVVGWKRVSDLAGVRRAHSSRGLAVELLEARYAAREQFRRAG